MIPANNVKSGWRSGKVKSTAYDYQNAVSRLDQFEKRLRSVMIECLDFREIIQRYDSPNTFFYIDPPYVGREAYYKGGFTEQDHIELAELLQNIKGKALISYYPDPLILSLYKNWNIESAEAVTGSGVCKAENGQKRRKAEELFIMNYGKDHQKLETQVQAQEWDLFSLGAEPKKGEETEPIQLQLF
ncbi:DNA adenine methylase [Priestia filamentosa]|uniref:DNA adenine methylase n=1 Tax=Priestia filamentosa TaxID=1402861 RepID=UPI003982BA54